MKNQNSKLDRLLRAAAAVPQDPAPDMPFGFDTRVVAQAGVRSADHSLGVLLRRVVATALVVLALSSAAAWRESSQPADLSLDENAIADSVIGNALNGGNR